jgi:hypothetical protein
MIMGEHRTEMGRAALLSALVALVLAGCGGGTSDTTDDAHSSDAGAPLAVQHGTRSVRDGAVVQSVTYASGADRVEGYLVSPSSASGKLPAVVFLHGAGGDREEQLGTAVKLAGRGAVALTITVPSAARRRLPERPAGSSSAGRCRDRRGHRCRATRLRRACRRRPRRPRPARARRLEHG